MLTRELIDKIAVYTTRLFDNFHTDELVYHNLHHTHTVVKRVNEIALNYSLSDEMIFIINAAAWFHDVGQLFGLAFGHEEKSILIMNGFLKKTGADENSIRHIEACIIATCFPYQPESLAGEILCDADSFHFGTTEFLVTDNLVKEEFKRRNSYVPENWNEATLAILEQHHYFTPYCISLLQQGKEQNMDIVRNKIKTEKL